MRDDRPSPAKLNLFNTAGSAFLSLEGLLTTVVLLS
jgi:hypothetical protein